MSAEYVRRYYRVPAKRGMRVTVDGKPGTIIGFRHQYLRVRFDGDKHALNAHPTWRVEYPAGI
jgi:hypothetical protein